MKSFRSKMTGKAAYVLLALPFLLPEIYLRLDLISIRYFTWKMGLPCILFFGIWTALFLVVSLVLPRKAGRIVYGVLASVHLIFFLADVITFDYTEYCFSFTLMRMAGEGKDYIWDTVKAMRLTVLLTAALSVAGCGVKNTGDVLPAADGTDVSDNSEAIETIVSGEDMPDDADAIDREEAQEEITFTFSKVSYREGTAVQSIR